MSRLEERLSQHLRLRGASSAADLRRALGVSQPTVSRTLSGMSGIVRLGAGPGTRYALARRVHGLGEAVPLYALDGAGQASRFGTLFALEHGQWHFAQDYPWQTLRASESDDGLFPGLPWFLDDLRPQGFLGRNFARQLGPSLGFPTDARDWTADQVITALVRHGGETPGAFVVGQEMLSRVQALSLRPAEAIDESARASAYETLASEALAGGHPGSSAAGEQPKFLTVVRRPAGQAECVIVKFSGPRSRPDETRWADLLASEFIVDLLLVENGIAAARTGLVEGAERLFLESTRFDRVGPHGRRAVVTLWAIDGAFFGEPQSPWTDAARRLEAAGWLTVEDARTLETLWWYGTLIGNSDMHGGNVSFFLSDSYPFRLAPVYDMLPMLYRPGPQGSLPPREFAPPTPPPEALDQWRRAAVLAGETWSRISQHPIVSANFREIAKANEKTVRQYRRRFDA